MAPSGNTFAALLSAWKRQVLLPAWRSLGVLVVGPMAVEPKNKCRGATGSGVPGGTIGSNVPVLVSAQRWNQPAPGSGSESCAEASCAAISTAVVHDSSTAKVNEASSSSVFLMIFLLCAFC